MKIQVVCDINTVFVISDTGYTRDMSTSEIEKWAKDKMRTVQVLLQKGATEPKAVHAKFVIREVRFTPDDGEVNG